jgi:hypothetical protein
MQLIPKGCTDPNEVFHVPTGVGKGLILTGVVEEYIPPVKPDLPTQWNIFNGGFNDSPPILKAYCPVCKATTTWENATEQGLEQKKPFRHHLGAEFCPADVRENYLAQMNRWMKVHRPKQARAVAEQQEALKHAVAWR